MKSAFLDNLTLQTLLAPVTEEQFRSHHWDRTPLVVTRGDPDYYGDLFTLDDFDRELASAPDRVVIAEATRRRYTRFRAKTAPIPFEQVLGDMREGTTLLLEQLHNREHKLGLLCRILEQQLGHRFHTNLYLTPPHGKGLVPHWDNHDTFILQVFGSKHWKVEKRRRTLPDIPDKMGEQGRVVAPDAHAFTLNQGDMVYIPRGYVHAAECGSEPSLHITLGLIIYTWSDLLHAAVEAAVRGDESLRYALPLGFIRGDHEGLVNRVKAALRETADDGFLTAVVNGVRDELVRGFPLDISGQVRDFFRPAPLALEDVVGPRRGIFYRMHSGEDSVRVSFGTRDILFPGFFGEALDFALNTPAYAIRDIAGELEDEEKLVFIERLMQEGLVVRK